MPIQSPQSTGLTGHPGPQIARSQAHDQIQVLWRARSARRGWPRGCAPSRRYRTKAAARSGMTPGPGPDSGAVPGEWVSRPAAGQHPSCATAQGRWPLGRHYPTSSTAASCPHVPLLRVDRGQQRSLIPLPYPYPQISISAGRSLDRCPISKLPCGFHSSRAIGFLNC